MVESKNGITKIIYAYRKVKMEIFNEFFFIDFNEFYLNVA